MLESLLFNIAALRTGEKEDVVGLRGASLKVGEERGGEKGRIYVCMCVCVCVCVCVYGGGEGRGGEGGLRCQCQYRGWSF